jgi:hypothetical protein
MIIYTCPICKVDFRKGQLVTDTTPIKSGPWQGYYTCWSACPKYHPLKATEGYISAIVGPPPNWEKPNA